MDRIDQWLGKCHFRERHSIEIQAGCGDAYQALKTIDLGESGVIRFFFALRGVAVGAAQGAAPVLPMNKFLAQFTLLEERPPRELLVGAVGQFWRLKGGSVPIDAERFVQFADPGLAKLVMNFATKALGDTRTLMTTETRVWCTDAAARRRFAAYWYLIRPASGLIRREMLRLTKARAESESAR
jgi:hypothetical protein